jgi:hypothetical protein
MHRADEDFGLPKRTDEGRVARKKGLAQIATELGKYVLNAADVSARVVALLKAPVHELSDGPGLFSSKYTFNWSKARETTCGTEPGLLSICLDT